MERLLAAFTKLQDWFSQARRFAALFDKSAWLMAAPALIGLYYLDAALTKTMAQWLVVSFVIAGVSIVVSRIIFPQIHLSELVEQVKAGNRAAGTLAAALVIFVGILFYGIVMWAKA
jgi:hypothetical protein